MKNVVILLFALVLITSCGGQKKQEEKEVRNVQLKGEEMPVDTALFRYAYRIRVQGDKAVVFIMWIIIIMLSHIPALSIFPLSVNGVRVLRR